MSQYFEKLFSFLDLWLQYVFWNHNHIARCTVFNSTFITHTFKKGIFVHPPWVPNCMQNLKGGWKFSFPKMFDSYRDLFLIVPLKSELIKENNEFW